ncbi:hypothetical protein [Geminicoccus harenae]|uniref:hypothetical protein n=1 Tax=Geminicoccus harenae TaxID=2498453 RepID=UPI00168B85BB|nr:hypothetical protein [Geminicoccus harenae]
MAMRPLPLPGRPPPDRAVLRARLTMAENHLAAGELGIDRTCAYLARQQAAGRNTRDSEAALQARQAMQAQWRRHSTTRSRALLTAMQDMLRVFEERLAFLEQEARLTDQE